MELDRDSGKTLAEQLEDSLRMRIVNGEWHPNALIPSEAALAAEYRINRTTVRTALSKLQNAGLVHRIKGKGTAVCSQKLLSSIPFSGLRDCVMASVQDERDTIEVLEISVVPAPDDICEVLRLKHNSSVLFAMRRYVSEKTGKPRTFISSWVPYEYAKLINTVDLQTRTFKQLFTEKGLLECNRTEWLEVDVTNKETSKILDVPVGTAVFIIDELRKNASGSPFYFRRMTRLGNSLRLKFSTDKD